MIIIPHKRILTKSKKTACVKCMYGLTGNYFRVATLSKSYLTVTGIIMKSLKWIGQFQHEPFVTNVRIKRPFLLIHSETKILMYLLLHTNCILIMCGR